MPDKLSIINECLGLTGNNLVNVADDGSDEWLVGSLTYDAAVKTLLDEHDWKFGTQIFTLQRTGDSDDPDYADVYAKPTNALHLTWVRDANGNPVLYKIIGNQVHVNAAAGTILKAKVVMEPSPEAWPGLFLEALRCFVKAGCYSGLNEDPDEARKMRQEGRLYLTDAKTRGDQEEPGKVLFKTRARTIRRTRRYP